MHPLIQTVWNSCYLSGVRAFKKPSTILISFNRRKIEKSDTIRCEQRHSSLSLPLYLAWRYLIQVVSSTDKKEMSAR